MKEKALSLFLLNIALTLAAAVVFVGCTTPNQDINSTSILFVGNSHTYKGNVPKQLMNISGIYGVEITYKDISKPDATLSDSKNRAIKEMKRRIYDYVVFQDNSLRPVRNIEAFMNDMRTLCDEAVKNGAIPVLYNPARANADGRPDEELQAVLSEKYKQAAYENDAILVNSGDAWVYAYQSIPEISLFSSDNHHANRTGAYYTACVFASTLFNLHVKDIEENNTNTFKDDVAIALGQLAWEFVHQSSTNPR